MNYVSNFEIFFSYERFVTIEITMNYENVFPGYKLIWISATRAQQTRGRTSGGCLYGYKKFVKQVYQLSLIKHNDTVFLRGHFGRAFLNLFPT